MTAPNEAQAAYWEERAPSWLEADDLVERVAGAFGALAIEGLGPLAGHRVLDIGCGPGSTTLDLARAVGPAGEAVGVDISATMVAEARARAAAAGVGDVHFLVADAQVDDLGEETFDAAFSRSGVMFFADPLAAFANIGRSLRPGGRLAFTCWQEVGANEWMSVPGVAVIAATGMVPPMPRPGEPGPFAFADAARVRSVLEGAGFDEVEVRPRTFEVVRPESEIPAMVHASTLVGMVRQLLDGADDDVRATVVEAVERAFRDRLEDGEVRLGSAAFVVTARRP